MTPEERAEALDGISAALARAFPDRTEELLAETTLALWPFAFICWLCSVGWGEPSTVCGACRRTCRALVDQAGAGRTRPTPDMVLSELGRALREAEHPRAEELVAAVRVGLAPFSTVSMEVPPCRLCQSVPPPSARDVYAADRRLCSACVLRIATAGDGPVRVR